MCDITCIQKSLFIRKIFDANLTCHVYGRFRRANQLVQCVIIYKSVRNTNVFRTVFEIFANPVDRKRRLGAETKTARELFHLACHMTIIQFTCFFGICKLLYTTGVLLRVLDRIGKKKRKNIKGTEMYAETGVNYTACIGKQQ